MRRGFRVAQIASPEVHAPASHALARASAPAVDGAPRGAAAPAEGGRAFAEGRAAGADVRAKASALHPVPRKALVGFERVRVAKGASARVRFDFGASALELVNATGGRQLYAGTHELIFSRGHGREERVEVKL